VGKRFSIQVAGESVLAELLEDEAPGISHAFWDCLPLDSVMVHAKFAGQESIIMLPFFHGPENEFVDVKPGDIGYYPGRQTACLFYGPTQPFGAVSLYAQVVENLDGLARAGDRLLEVGQLPVRLQAIPQGVLSGVGR
jgi:hypothetical protein